MNYQHRKFWDKALDEIDEELSDRCAEHLTRVGGVELDDIPEDGGKAVEVRTSPAKKSRAPIFAAAGLGAAAVIIGLTVKFGGGLPIAVNSVPESEPTAESGETDEDTETIETIVDINAQPLVDWDRSIELFEQYFMGEWTDADWEYEKEGEAPVFPLTYETYLGGACTAEGMRFTETDEGCWLMGVGEEEKNLFVSNIEPDVLHVQTPDGEKRYYRTSTGGGSGGVAGNLLWLHWFAGELGMPVEVLTNCTFTDSSGTVWTRDSTDDGLVRLHRCSDGEVNISMPFHTDAGASRIWGVTFAQQDGSWQFSHATESTFLDVHADDEIGEGIYSDEFDTEIFEICFAGYWTSEGEQYYYPYLHLDYHQESGGYWGLRYIRFDGCIEKDNGWWLTGMAGGMGQFVFIPADDQDTLIIYSDWEPSRKYSEGMVYHRVGFCEPEHKELYGELSLAGRKSLDRKLESLGDSFKSAYDEAMQDFTAEFNGNTAEWTWENMNGGLEPISDLSFFTAVLELSEDRVVLVRQFAQYGTYNEHTYMDDIRPFAMTFEKSGEEWSLTDRSYDVRFDSNVLDMPDEPGDEYYCPYLLSWISAGDIDEEADVDMEMLELDELSFTDPDGTLWTLDRDGIDHTSFRCQYWVDADYCVSLPFVSDSGMRALRMVDFMANNTGIFFDENIHQQWYLNKVYYYDCTDKTDEVMWPAMNTAFSLSSYNEIFAGYWQNTDPAAEPAELVLDTVSDNALGFTEFQYCYRTADGGSILHGVKDDVIMRLYIPADDPESMYLYLTFNGEVTRYNQPSAVFRRTGYVDSAALEISENYNLFAENAVSRGVRLLDDEAYSAWLAAEEAGVVDQRGRWVSDPDAAAQLVYADIDKLVFKTSLKLEGAEGVTEPFAAEFENTASYYDYRFNNLTPCTDDVLSFVKGVLPLSESEAEALFCGEWQNTLSTGDSLSIAAPLNSPDCWRGDSGAYYRASDNVIYLIPSGSHVLLKYDIGSGDEVQRISGYTAAYIRP